MTFCITAMGRSGTTFLSAMLNQSPTWTVEHEPGGTSLSVRESRKRFQRQKYGEVNTFIRFQVMALDVDYRAVIIRRPLEIAQSMHNRFLTDVRHLNDSLLCLDGLIQSGLPVISFHQLVHSDLMVRAVGNDCGIFDLPHQLSPVGRNESAYRVLPADLRRDAESVTGWFDREYESYF